MRVGYFTMPLHPPGADPGGRWRTTSSSSWPSTGSASRRPGSASTSPRSGRTSRAPTSSSPRRSALHAADHARAPGSRCLPNHNPLMLAQRIAQLDQMAQGRFLWGVGSGGFPGDLELFELDAKAGEHRTVTRDVLDVILDLWDDPKPGVYEHAALALPRARAAGGHRAPPPPPSVPAAAPADRRGRGRPRVGHADPGRRAGLDPDEHQHRAAPRAQDALEPRSRRARGRAAAWPIAPTWRIARDVYIGDTTARGAARGARRARWRATGATTSSRCLRRDEAC